MISKSTVTAKRYKRAQERSRKKKPDTDISGIPSEIQKFKFVLKGPLDKKNNFYDPELTYKMRNEI